MKFGIIGSGSWATALTKILTDNKQQVNWWVRSEAIIKHLRQRHHNPNYLSSVYFDTSLLSLHTDVNEVVSGSDYIIIAVPSAFVVHTLQNLEPGAFSGKKVLSAVKGILPDCNELLHNYLAKKFGLHLNDYFTIMGPCHAEEVAGEKLSYLTFSGADQEVTTSIAGCFQTEYLNTVTNNDVVGVQYAAVLKNIYALGAGIAHGLDYGDNFLSVLIANSADEMAGFLKKMAALTGTNTEPRQLNSTSAPINYAASVYLGDLLVTCYSLYSRNRTFGNMIGKGYSVRSAQLEMNMIAEGYNASKCIHLINQDVQAAMPIMEAIYHILWQGISAGQAFKKIEENLV
ncbi:MAG TPA: NAD(P)H-dependent glycerol-3-phosphate dehydrogenase [Chitinophagaceae bacterium]|jgi:glycerol-3-phosphate dehydrogenase (NAD(P)+)|nr:NAD(P)H-dependent glycerol-3-phosphate dehydrogenase [Chitinophagaceae bacterium]